MALTIITIALAPVIIVWVGSHRHGALNLFFSILLAFAVSASAGMLVPLREAWIGPVFFAVSFLVIIGYFVCVDRSAVQSLVIGDFVEGIGGIFTNSRRRSSVRSDVRRLVKQYNIEVES